mgnify:CR=1 FL=1
MKRLARHELKSEFSDIEPYVDKFTEKYPEFDKYAMIADLINGNSVMWKGDKFFVIGRPNRYHNKEVFLIEALGGEGPEEWLDLLPQIEEEVRVWGFPEIEFYGRLGWQKLFKGRGYSPEKIVMRKQLA